MSPYTTDEALERNREWSRRAKQKRRGRCERCGAETRYNGSTVNGPSRFCRICGPRLVGESRRGTGYREQQVLDFVGDGQRRFTEIRKHLGITKPHTSNLLHRLVRYGQLERVDRGLYQKKNPPGLTVHRSGF